MFTLGDLSKSLRAYVGNDASETKTAAAKRAAVAGLRLLSSYRNWSYYQTIGRITTVAQQSLGTVAYDHTGGAYERMLTLTPDTTEIWPTWSQYGTVVIANVAYDVDVRKSSTVITLKETSNPGADVAALTTYRIYRARFPMPSDFVSSDQPIVGDGGEPLSLFQLRDWVLRRSRNDGDGQPREYCFVGNGSGGTDVIVWPPPDAIYPLEFLYRRKPTQPTLDEESRGKLTITSSSSAAVGSSTQFDTSHIGCVLRVSRNGTPPTAPDGANPAVFETTVTGIISAVGLNLTDAATASFQNVAYTLSSPLDVEDGPMWDLLIQKCRKELRIETRMNLTNEELQAYNEAVVAACGDDGGKPKERRVAGMAGSPYNAGPRGWPNRTD